MEVFGTVEQQRFLRKGIDLMAILADDPRFCSHGRGVQLADFSPGDDTFDLLVRLTRLSGVSGCEMVPDADAPALISRLHAAGFKTDCYANFIGAEQSVEIARKTLAAGGLPPDLTVQIIDADAPAHLLEGFAKVSLAQGVLPSAGPVMRGVDRPGFGMVALDASGEPVATAAGSLARHPTHPDHDMAQWGQLATRDDRKGQGIARAMACLSLVHGWDVTGIRRFSTGIREGNLPSENLCRSLGLAPSGFTIVLAIDTESFSGDRATK